MSATVISILGGNVVRVSEKVDVGTNNVFDITIAQNEKDSEGNETATYYTCAVWNRPNLRQHIEVGKPMVFMGRMEDPKTYEKKDGSHGRENRFTVDQVFWAGRGLNVTIASGNIGADAELKYTANGIAVTNISLASNLYAGKDENGQAKEKTLWSRVTIWRERAEALIRSGLLTKGTRAVVVMKHRDTGTYVANDGTVRANNEYTMQDIVIMTNGEAPEGMDDPLADMVAEEFETTPF